MTWKMTEGTAQRLKAHAQRKARLLARSDLKARLADLPVRFSVLDDEAHDTLIAAIRQQPKKDVESFERTFEALAVLRAIAPRGLPDLSVFLG